jgi:hypothetical protein
MVSPHGNSIMGSFNVFEQHEHVNCDFLLDIFQFLIRIVFNYASTILSRQSNMLKLYFFLSSKSITPVTAFDMQSHVTYIFFGPFTYRVLTACFYVLSANIENISSLYM